MPEGLSFCNTLLLCEAFPPFPAFPSFPYHTLLLFHPNRARLRLDPLSVLLCPGLGKLGAEQDDQPRVLDPDEHDDQRACSAIGFSWVAVTYV